MDPISLMLMGGGGILGYDQAAKQKQQQMIDNAAQAELTRYSPWTGMKGQINTKYADPFAAALGGGMQGLGVAQGLGTLGKKTPAPAAQAEAQPMMSAWSGLDARYSAAPGIYDPSMMIG